MQLMVIQTHVQAAASHAKKSQVQPQGAKSSCKNVREPIEASIVDPP